MKDDKKTTKYSENSVGNPNDDIRKNPSGNTDRKKELGGREGPEPTRYGDWENNGIASDF